MNYKMMPTMSISALEEALIAQYDMFADCEEDLRSLLFDDNYTNDCYKRYYIDDIEVYEGKSWQNEARIRAENCVKTFLKDLFPECDAVLIDVSW